jgi:hypothetical protein
LDNHYALVIAHTDSIYASYCISLHQQVETNGGSYRQATTGSVALHLQMHVVGFTTSALRGLETPNNAAVHDVQQHERMTVDLPPWRKRSRMAGRILSLHGTGLRGSTLVGVGGQLRSLSASENQPTVDTFVVESQLQALQGNNVRCVTMF